MSNVVSFYLTKDGYLFSKGAVERKYLDLYRREGFELVEGFPPTNLQPPPLELPRSELGEEGYPPLQVQLNWLWDAMDKGDLPKDNKFYRNLKPVMSLPKRQKSDPANVIHGPDWSAPPAKRPKDPDKPVKKLTKAKDGKVI